MIKNVAKSQGEKKIQKPGETRRKSQKPAPGTRRFFNQEKSLKTRRLLAKSGGLATLVFLVNRGRSKLWVPGDQNPPPVARQDRFGKKVMLCVWWNVDGVVHFELVPDGRAVNAELYSEQLERVYNVLKQRYPTLIRRKRALLQHDNGPAHRANFTKEKLDELDGVEVLPHPAYSSDLAPSDYGLFRSMEHFLRGRRFETFDQVEAACREFFESKEPHWYRDQIRQLAERWRKVIENDGLYFEE